MENISYVAELGIPGLVRLLTKSGVRLCKLNLLCAGCSGIVHFDQYPKPLTPKGQGTGRWPSTRPVSPFGTPLGCGVLRSGNQNNFRVRGPGLRESGLGCVCSTVYSMCIGYTEGKSLTKRLYG